MGPDTYPQVSMSRSSKHQHRHGHCWCHPQTPLRRQSDTLSARTFKKKLVHLDHLYRNIRPSVRCWRGHGLTNVDILRKMLVEWVVERCHAFIEIESPKLRAILKYVDPCQSSNMLMANKIQLFLVYIAIVQDFQCLYPFLSVIHDLLFGLIHNSTIPKCIVRSVIAIVKSQKEVSLIIQIPIKI